MDTKSTPELAHLITVTDRFQADVLRGHLTSEGIFSETRGGGMPPYFNNKGPFVEFAIFVHPDDLDTARTIISGDD